MLILLILILPECKGNGWKTKNPKAGLCTKIIYRERKPVKMINECQQDSDIHLTTSWGWKENETMFCGQVVVLFSPWKTENPRAEVWNPSYI